MSKSNRTMTCPHCGERIIVKNTSNVSRNNNSIDFFNDDEQTQEDIKRLLKDKNIEFGVVRKKVKNKIE